MGTTVIAPERSRQQRLEALERANEIRTKRADVKRGFKLRGLPPAEVLLDLPAELQGMKLWDLLIAIPRIGRVKANRLLIHAKASPSKTLAGLNDRQRAAVVGVLAQGEPYVIPNGERKVARPARSRRARRERPRRPVPRTHCQRCRAKLYVPTVDRLCGFCKDRP